MERHKDLPSELEATSLDELVADGAVVRHLLGTPRRAVVPRPRGGFPMPDSAIPDSAVAVVSGLDTYGD
jgi:hypothetical protein